MNIKEICKIHGVENVKIVMGCLPLREAFFICYTSNSDDERIAEFSICEDRYKVSEGYKIGFHPTVTKEGCILAPNSYYQSDLESMLRSGHASIRVINLIDVA